MRRVKELQTEVPMIHLLYSRTTMIVSRIMRRLVKADAVNKISPEDLKIFDIGIGNHSVMKILPLERQGRSFQN